MMDCAEMELLVQADVDGELTPAEAARVAAHVPGCAHCTRVQGELIALGAAVQEAGLRFAMPAGLEAALRGQIAALLPPSIPPVIRYRRWQSGRRVLPFGAGFAVAAALALLVLLPSPPLPDDVTASHIRALQPGHLMDVASSDQHTVKPWFDGRIDFAPPVKDLAAARFPLLGGRLDYLAGRPAAALVYGRDKHIIDLFVWPERAGQACSSGARNGYNLECWTANSMMFWAVSDLNARELADFARLWQAG